MEKATITSIHAIAMGCKVTHVCTVPQDILFLSLTEVYLLEYPWRHDNF